MKKNYIYLMVLIIILCSAPLRAQDDQQLEKEIEELLAGAKSSEEIKRPAPSSTGRYFQSLNPDISVIVDTFYQRDDSKEGIAHIFEETEGFGHSCTAGHHHGPDEGFNMNHLELYFSANADPYFKGWGVAAVTEEGAEMEEAVIQTTALPHGLQLKFGKFFSDFGRINPQHAHSWDFSDQPLIYRLTLGTHGLNDKGIQASWLMPTDFYLLAGLEAFQGNNEVMFNHIGGDHLSDKSGPRIFVGWLKLAPNLANVNHAIQFGTFFSRGVHQEEHDGNTDGTYDHWLTGHSKFGGFDFVYKFDDLRAYGVGDITVQGEYFQRRKDLTVENHDLNTALIGRDKIEKQDGYYLQTTYGFLPRWRVGVRWDRIGMINDIDLPPGTSSSPDGSDQLALMVDWTLSEFSRLRFQYTDGDYETEEGKEDVSRIFLQLQISLGTHGAHKF
ncbi:MAG: TonB-dependent receptor [Planctomycetes bacterium]|nr:TonB-dependent receptor [Planctomycetota bacterium]